MKSQFITLALLAFVGSFVTSCNKDTVLDVKTLPTVQLFKFTKTPCFGFCDVYEFSINSDQTACLKGEMYSSELSKRSSYPLNCIPVNNSIWEEIKNKALSIDLQNLEAVYPVDGQVIPDLPTTIIEINLGNKTIKIKDTNGAPQNLEEFELFVEKMLGELKSKFPIEHPTQRLNNLHKEDSMNEQR